jgi:hypothetical protein
MAPSLAHTERIRRELRNAGLTSFGMLRFSCRHLPEIIHEDEHIEAAAYGRYREGGGLLNFSEGILVATSHRIIFLDHKPGYTTLDEVGYDLVAGIKYSTAGMFSAVTVHTRIGDFTIRFAKPSCVENLVHYVEARRLEPTNKSSRAAASSGVPHGLRS